MWRCGEDMMFYKKIWRKRCPRTNDITIQGTPKHKNEVLHLNLLYRNEKHESCGLSRRSVSVGKLYRAHHGGTEA